MASSAIAPKKVMRPRGEQLRLMAIGADSSFALAGGYGLSEVFYENLTANAVTINIGTTDAGTDVASGVAIGANACGHIAGATLAKRYFSRTTPQTLYVTSGGWNSASVNVIMIADKVSP